MERTRRIPLGEPVKSAWRDRKNFLSPLRSKIVSTHLWTGSPGALSFASSMIANLAVAETRGNEPEGRRSPHRNETGSVLDWRRGIGVASIHRRQSDGHYLHL